MELIEQFRWTTRTDVCRQLLRIALQAGRRRTTDEGEVICRESDPPERAIDLLLQFADRSCWEYVEPLAPLLRGVRHVGWQVQYLRLKPEFTAEDVANLYTTLRSPTGRFAAWSAASILALSPPDDNWRAARKFLGSLSPLERAQVLCDWFSARSQPLPDSSLSDWLYDRWLAHDRAAVGDASFGRAPLNLLIALETRHRPESRSLLIKMWPHLSEHDRQTVFRCLRGFAEGQVPQAGGPSPAGGTESVEKSEEDQALLSACVDSDPQLREKLWVRLALPLPYLQRHLGTEALLELIETKIAAFCRTRGTVSSDSEDYEAFYPALRHLPELHGDQVEAHLRLFCLRSEYREVHNELRRVFWEWQWRNARAEALSLAQAAAEEGDRAWAAEAVQQMYGIMLEQGGCLEAADRGFLFWASRQRLPMFRYVAVVGLDELKEDSPEWRQRLYELARDRSPVVRVVAWSAVARRGDESCVPPLTRIATRARNVRLRAEVLRVLGDVDAARHLHVLQRALLSDHAEVDRDMPAAREAAAAFIRLGTPEAFTILIRAGLSGPSDLWWLVMEGLSKCAPFAEPPEVPPPLHTWSWRLSYHRVWLMGHSDGRRFSPLPRRHTSYHWWRN